MGTVTMITVTDPFGHSVSVQAGSDGVGPVSFNNPAIKTVLGRPKPNKLGYRHDNAGPNADDLAKSIDAINLAINATGRKRVTDRGTPIGGFQPTGCLEDSYPNGINDPTPPAATFGSISPTSGTAAGGTTVTVTGTNLDLATGMTIGGIAVTSFTRLSNTQVRGVTGAHATGAVNVVVADDSGPVTGAGAFTYT